MNALIAIANGIEDMETVIAADILVRAGMNVTLASVEDKQIKASRGVSIVADALIEDVAEKEFDVVICPGGLPGAQALQDSQILKSIILRQHSHRKWLAAICASPAYVLAHHGILDSCKATCYPGNEECIKHYVNQSVVTDSHVITSRGPGTAIPFALEIVTQMMGSEVARKVASQGLFG